MGLRTAQNKRIFLKTFFAKMSVFIQIFRKKSKNSQQIANVAQEIANILQNANRSFYESRKKLTLKNASLIAKTGVGTAENGPIGKS